MVPRASSAPQNPVHHVTPPPSLCSTNCSIDFVCHQDKTSVASAGNARGMLKTLMRADGVHQFYGLYLLSEVS